MRVEFYCGYTEEARQRMIGSKVAAGNHLDKKAECKSNFFEFLLRNKRGKRIIGEQIRC